MAKSLDNMTVDELDKASVKLKQEIDALREKRQAIREARDKKVEADRKADAKAAEGKPGVVVSVPGPRGDN